MYNSGARVSEVAGLKRSQVHFGARSYIELHGKGRKERTVPLWSHSAHVLRESGSKGNKTAVTGATSVLFPSLRGNPLCRDSIHHLLRQAVQKAAAQCISLGAEVQCISHMLFDTQTAVHLLHSLASTSRSSRCGWGMSTYRQPTSICKPT